MLYNSYTWRNYLCTPYESLWSIVQKFCMLNSITEAEFYQRLCGRLTYSGKLLQEFSPYHIYRMTTPSTNDINSAFHITEKDYSVLNCFTVNHLETYMKKELFYCPICIKYGYHSIFHQLSFINNCFIHKEQSLVKAINREYALLYSQKLPYEGLDFLPNTKDILINSGHLSEKINNLLFKLPNSIKVIDPYYKKYNYPILNNLKQSTKKVLYSLTFGNVTQQPIYEISLQENDKQFDKLRTVYSHKYDFYYYDSEIKYNSDFYPSVYLSIFDYVKELLSNMSEKEIHGISNNLRYNNVISEGEDNKYVDFLTASSFLCSLKDKSFITLGKAWAYDNNYENMNYYVDLLDLESEVLTHDSKKYHYILKLIFGRIADKVKKQLQSQYNLAHNNPLMYEYDISIPQYVVTFENDTFRIYECV